MPGMADLFAANGADNLSVIRRTDEQVSTLRDMGISSGHFTNGVYSYAKELIVPTVLAGFQYAIDNDVGRNTPLILAINSDASLQTIAQKKMQALEEKISNGEATVAQKEALQAQNSSMENWILRTFKVANPLARQNPDRKVIVIYYDEETPNALYGALKESGFGMKSLFKWGYGTDPKAGVIEGAENFGKVYGFPLPNDIKPVCTDITRMTGQAGNIVVADLRQTLGPHGKPYISPQNECLFSLDGGLLEYGPRNNPVRAKEEPQAKL